MIKPYQLTVNAENGNADLYILGDIAEEAWMEDMTSPSGIMEALKGAAGEIVNVHINSYGGSTSAGITIYNMLKNCGKSVTTIAEGFACSAASLIFCAGDKRVMRKSSLLMIHNAWCCAQGNADEMRKVAEDLEKISSVAATIYAENSALEPERIQELLSAETWITPEEAVEYGLATEIEEDMTGDEPAYSSAFRCIAKAVMQKKEAEQSETIKVLETARETIERTNAMLEKLKAMCKEEPKEEEREPETKPEQEEKPVQAEEPVPQTHEKTAFECLFDKFK